MRFLADENVPLASADHLAQLGHDVRSVTREGMGSADSVVLARAELEDRIVRTFDRDFGELVYRLGASGRPGVVLVRFVPRTSKEPAEILSAAITDSAIQLTGQFTVVTRDHIRQRPLRDPGAAG